MPQHIKTVWTLFKPESLFAPLWLWIRALGPACLSGVLAYFGFTQWAIPIFLLGVFPLVMHPYHEFCRWAEAGLKGHNFIPQRRKDELDQVRHEQSETHIRLVQ